MDRKSYKQNKKAKLLSGHKRHIPKQQKRRNVKKYLDRMDHASEGNANHKQLVDVINASNPTLNSPLEVYEKIKEVSNTRERSKMLFEWLIRPISIEQFFKDYWEKKALVIKRAKSDYFSHLFSSEEFDTILRKESIEYSVNLDVTQYEDGKRETLNPEGRAYPSVVWKFYEEGCSLRFLNPQTYSDSLWWLNATLQDYFQSFVGANMYLTPPNSQGFAPHYDDIEAFILQIEGEKIWKLHPPRNDGEILARESSGNFSDKDLQPSILSVKLEPGDLLYFPRGFIHQASTVPRAHSLHLTLSTYQKNSWGDFLLQLLPDAVNTALQRDVEFRRGLPLQSLSHIGQEPPQTEEDKIKRQEFKAQTIKLLQKLTGYINIDTAADKKYVSYIHESLPPALTNAEASTSALAITRWDNSSLKQFNLELTSNIRLLRPDAIRLVHENNQAVLYSNTENSRVYHEKPLQSLELETEFIAAVHSLIKTYPLYTAVQDLSCKSDSNKIDIAEVLFAQNLLQVELEH